MARNREENYWMHRTLCDVLDEMRQCIKTLNFGPTPSLVEEAQAMGNRMEAALSQKNDLINMDENWHSMRGEIKRLRKAINTAKETYKAITGQEWAEKAAIETDAVKIDQFIRELLGESNDT